jgi:hypothetical protein
MLRVDGHPLYRAMKPSSDQQAADAIQGQGCNRQRPPAL